MSARRAFIESLWCWFLGSSRSCGWYGVPRRIQCWFQRQSGACSSHLKRSEERANLWLAPTACEKLRSISSDRTKIAGPSEQLER